MESVGIYVVVQEAFAQDKGGRTWRDLPFGQPLEMRGRHRVVPSMPAEARRVEKMLRPAQKKRREEKRDPAVAKKHHSLQTFDLLSIDSNFGRR